jgi:putative heme-binding domain-containing protein
MLAALDMGLAMIGGNSKQNGLPLGTAFTDIAEKSKPQTTRRARRLETVPPEFAPLLQRIWSDTTSDPLVIQLAMRLGSKPAYDRAIALTGDAAVPEKTRLAILDTLNELGDVRSVPVLLALIGGRSSPAIQQRVLRVLAQYSHERIPRTVLAAYPKYDATLRSAARTLLFSRADWAAMFIAQIERGTYPTSEVSIEELRNLAVLNDERVNALVRKHWGEIRSGTPEEKLAEIRRLSNDLRAAEGNLAAGHELFKKHCATCHQMFGEGNKIGPDLTTANRKDRDYLLVSMVDPSAQIRKEFMSYVVTTVDGLIVTGLMADQTPTHITLVGAKNERTTIARSDIDSIKESTTSLMPEKQLEPFKPQEIRDLFRFLQQ